MPSDRHADGDAYNTPESTYWGLLKSGLPTVALGIVSAYAAFSVIMDTTFLVHLHVTHVWFVEDAIAGIEPWMVWADLAVWAFVLYKCWGYARD